MAEKAIFLDRDGVLTKERKDRVKTIGELEMIPGAAESLSRLNALSFKHIIITNQSAINRGLTTHEEVAKIHEVMQRQLSSKGGRIDAVYYCPHRPDENCDCRKPKIGLFLRAAADYNIDLKNSWFIGDKESDELAAKNAGCHYAKVETNVPDRLGDAVSKILRSENAQS